MLSHPSLFQARINTGTLSIACMSSAILFCERRYLNFCVDCLDFSEREIQFALRLRKNFDFKLLLILVLFIHPCVLLLTAAAVGYT